MYATSIFCHLGEPKVDASEAVTRWLGRRALRRVEGLPLAEVREYARGLTDREKAGLLLALRERLP